MHKYGFLYAYKIDDFWRAKNIWFACGFCLPSCYIRLESSLKSVSLTCKPSSVWTWTCFWISMEIIGLMVRFRLFVHSFIKSLEKWCSHAFNALDQSGSHDFLNNVMANSLCSIMLVVLLFCCSEIRINLHGFTMNAIVVDSHFNTCIRSDFIYKVSWLLVNSVASTFCIYSLHFCVHMTYLNGNSTLFYRERKVK